MARLTTMARGGGCGCKLGKSALAEALALMPAPPPDARVLVGFDGADDAAAYRVRDDLAVVASVNFFTPIVDDPATFGAIAATNALSDLHAMGATPAFALAVAAHPADGDPDDLAAIMRGGAEAAMADGCPVLGGHTIDDPEPKYGLAAVGTAHPDRLLSNAAGRPGDLLFLTKPLGVGVITTAAMRDGCNPDAMAAATESMLASNRPAVGRGAGGGRALRDRRDGLRPAGPPRRAGGRERGVGADRGGRGAAAARRPRAGRGRGDDGRRRPQPGLRRGGRRGLPVGARRGGGAALRPPDERRPAAGGPAGPGRCARGRARRARGVRPAVGRLGEGPAGALEVAA